jgi:hypothetical protein
MRALLVVSVLIVMVGVASRGGAGQAGAVQACSLLTADEITGVTGAKAGEGRETATVLSSGPQKGETLAGWMWKLGEQGMVNRPRQALRGHRETQEPGLETGQADLR